jgi:hypothetical protein
LLNNVKENKETIKKIIYKVDQMIFDLIIEDNNIYNKDDININDVLHNIKKEKEKENKKLFKTKNNKILIDCDLNMEL